MEEPVGKVLITVTVSDTSSDALVGAVVTDGTTAVTPASGTVSMKVDIPSTVTASMSGYITASQPAATNVSFALQQTANYGMTKIIVTNSSGGETLPNATVTATPNTGAGITQLTNTSGVAAMSTPAGNYGVVVSKSGFTSSESHPVLVDSDGTSSHTISITPA